jgi:hypothetical protein
MMMQMAVVMNMPKRSSERFSGLRLTNKQTDVFYLCRPILFRLPIGQMEFCWRLEIAALPFFVRVGPAIIGD